MKVFSDPENANALLDLSANPVYILLSAVVNALVFPLLPIFACIIYFNGCAREDQAVAADNYPEKDEDEKVKVEDLYAKPLPENNTDEPENQ
jgi:hypothetical protein